MGKQSKSKKSDNFGKGKVTPVQVAFIVDRYLSDNNYSETRSIFRTEAASLISRSPVQEAPKSLLSLGAMLDEYICLKEQKVMLDQERARLEQEKCRVQTLLHGMQDVMNSYNASGFAPPSMSLPTTTRPVLMAPQSDPRRSSGSLSGCPVYNTPVVMPVSVPSNSIKEHTNFSSPNTNYPLTRKRMGSKAVVEAPPGAKKSRSKPNTGTSIATQLDNAVNSQEAAPLSSVRESSPHNRVPNGSLSQGSSVAKSLFNHPSIPTPPNPSGPKTPPQEISPKSDKSITPLGISSTANGSNNNTPQGITPTNCTVVSSERVRVSPCKQMTYYTMERSHCISSSSPVKTNLMRPNKRDHVKGRLDFDGSDVPVSLNKPNAKEISTSESEKEADIFDMDLPNLDVFGANFSFSELLIDFDLDCEGMGYPCQPALGAFNDTVSGSSNESRDCNLGADQVFSEFSSTVTEVLSEKNMNIQGHDTLTAVKSVTKCIKILSPAKNRRGSLDQENGLARN